MIKQCNVIVYSRIIIGLNAFDKNFECKETVSDIRRCFNKIWNIPWENSIFQLYLIFRMINSRRTDLLNSSFFSHFWFWKLTFVGNQI